MDYLLCKTQRIWITMAFVNKVRLFREGNYGAKKKHRNSFRTGVKAWNYLDGET